MSSNSATLLSHIDRETLTPLVQQALNSGTVRVVDWNCQEIYGGFGSYEGGAGVYRISGNGEDQGEKVSWALVLKALSPASGSKVTAESDYWKREALAYQSGLLSDLPGALTAPRCFGVTEAPTSTSSHEEAWIWLEEIKDETGPTWSSNLVGLAARCLGQFNGAYL